MILEEIKLNYEYNIGGVIVDVFKDLNLIYVLVVLVKNYGFFIWGKDVMEVVYNVVVLEEVVMMVLNIEFLINYIVKVMLIDLIEKYFKRKYGLNVYYG